MKLTFKLYFNITTYYNRKPIIYLKKNRYKNINNIRRWISCNYCHRTKVPVVDPLVVTTSVTVGLVVLTDTVVGPLVDVLTSGEVVVSTGKVVVLGTVVVSGEVVSVVDSTEVGGCVTTDI